METDLSLIEISGEDDSLLSLQQSPDDNVCVSNDRPYFSCSPLLQIPRSTGSDDPCPPLLASPAEVIKGEEDTCKPSSSLCEDSKDDSTNKENVNGNKQEVPKLSVEPQQMKRKKKGGGYNLRKSLAWDRAFFTEEGVLDPLELSMLSGEMLSVIHEGRDSLTSELDSACVSPGLQALKGNLFKQLPSNASSEGRKIADKMSPKLVSPARDKISTAFAAKRKVLSSHDTNISASKRSGCPRPVASSSLKRTSNTNTMKVTTRGSRVSKPLAPKHESSVASTTSRTSETASHSKGNFTSHPVTVRENIGTKGISTMTKSGLNDTKSGPAGKLIKKSTGQPARRHVVKDSTELKIHSSSNVQLPQVSQENSSLEGLPDSVVPAASHDTGTGKNTFSLPQTPCYYGGNMQHAQPQIAKPSGLRMPSPSLGFFGQSRPSDSRNILQRGTQLCNLPASNIRNVYTAGVSNPFQRKPPRPSRIIPPCSSTPHSVASTVNAASCATIKSDMELSNMQKVALQLQFNSKNSDIVNHKQQHHDTDLKSLDHDETCKDTEKISCIGNTRLHINDSTLSLQSATCEHVEKVDSESTVEICHKSRDSTDAGSEFPHFVSPLRLVVEVQGPSGTKNTSAKQHVEDRQCKSSIKSQNVCSESQTAGVNTNPHLTSSQVHGDPLSGMDEFKLSLRQHELEKPGTCKVDISDMESQNGTLLKDILSEKVNEYNILNAANDVLEVQDCGAASYHQSHCTDMEPTKEEASGTDCLNGELLVGDAQTMSRDGTQLIESCKSLTNTSAADSDRMIIDNPSAKSAEQTQILNSCLIMKQVFKDNCEPTFNDCLLSGKNSEESQKKDAHQNVNSAESINDRGDELESSNAFCSVPPVNQDCGFAATGNLECLHVENALTTSVDNEPFEGEINIHQSSGSTASELQGGLSSIMYSEVAKDATFSLNKSLNDNKQDSPAVRPPNAVPFSDEWLAAFEAAGEEILARKGGAVQNSPPDKSVHEPGPWSPVKRKNNQGIGPYDCTKFTNPNIPSSTST